MSQMKNIVTWTSPLRSEDCFAVRSEKTDRFMGTIHCHDVYELHLIQGAAGAKRIVGDRVAMIGDLELVLLAQSYLPHAWSRGRCKSEEHTVLEIHFRKELFLGLVDKACFGAIEHMFELASSGLVFSSEVAQHVYSDLVSLTTLEDGMQRYMLFLTVLCQLAEDKQAQRIVGPGYVKECDSLENRNVAAVKHYIYDHYREDIYLRTLAQLVGVEEQWLSTLFRDQTGITVSEYINQVRLSQVSKRLMDTEDPVATIARECGFPNLANFNRHFKRFKGTTPVAFRREYRMNV